MSDEKKLGMFASTVFYLAEDTINNGDLEKHEVAGVLKKLADYQTDILCLNILTREELDRCQK